MSESCKNCKQYDRKTRRCEKMIGGTIQPWNVCAKHEAKK